MTKHARFVAAIQQCIESLAPEAGQSGYRWRIQTIAGPLDIDIDQPDRCYGGVSSVFTRFEDVEAARDLVASVGRTGKWNFHHSLKGHDVDEAVRNTIQQLRAILPKVPHA